ncbi:MAG: superoxide dismutase family protein [Fidelibacterota bacterium]
MKHDSKGIILGILVLGTVLGFPGSSRPPVLTAHADISGEPGSNVSGEALFVQGGSGILPTVLVVVEVRGLQPGSVHGLHIHEVGTCEPDFKAAGGHFDPGPYGLSDPDANHPFHMGDLPNLVAGETGVAVLEHRTSRITLSPGPLSLFDEDGSALIVHKDRDEGTTGVSGGAGGGRLACGVIERE